MIYAHPQSSMFAQRPMKAFENAAFQLERSACAVFGLATFGVHMTGKQGGQMLSLVLTSAYEGSGSDMKIWVPRRSPTKATWPSMLDNVSLLTALFYAFNVLECSWRHSGRHGTARLYSQRV